MLTEMQMAALQCSSVHTCKNDDCAGHETKPRAFFAMPTDGAALLMLHSSREGAAPTKCHGIWWDAALKRKGWMEEVPKGAISHGGKDSLFWFLFPLCPPFCSFPLPCLVLTLRYFQWILSHFQAMLMIPDLSLIFLSLSFADPRLVLPGIWPWNA